MSRRVLFAISLGVVILPFARAYGNEIDSLVDKLAGGDEHARAVARQLLPRYGVEALERLLPLLTNENAAVSRAAYNVVEDIANEAGAPGRESERVEATRILMRLVDPSQSPETKVLGLRLLPVATPDDYDVAPIGVLLTDQEPDLQEKARAALLHIGSHHACMALLDAVPKVEPDFACALLDAIGQLHDPASVMPAGFTAASHEDAEVRAAALRAVAWTGDPNLVQLFRDVRAKATPETEFDATNTMLLFAEAMAERGGNWDRSIALYEEILNSTQHVVLKSGALMGLGRFGDETVVDIIAAAAQHSNPDIQAAAVSAFAAMRGRGAVERIAQAYTQCAPPVRLMLIDLLGRRGEPALLPILQTEAKSQDPTLRMAALRALADSSAVDALPALVEVAQSGSEEERALALEGAKHVAGSIGSTGDAQAAGKAFLNLYNLAQSDDLRVTALEGLAKFPVADAYDVVMTALQSEALKAAAAKALPALLGPLAAAGDEQKALNVFDVATKADPSPDSVLRLAAKLQGISSKLDTTRLLGVINFWYLVGPFDWKTDEDWGHAFVGEPDIDLTARYPRGDQRLTWKPVSTEEATGLVDLIPNVAQQDRCFAYAYTEIEVPEAMPAQFRIGSDDGNALWLNGTRLWENRCDRPCEVDQDIVDCQLIQGTNKVLMKLSQGTGGWSFRVRVTRPDGTAVPFEIRRPQ